MIIFPDDDCWFRSVLNYTDKISQHWPQFGQHGKSDLTVADVLRHEAGLPIFSQQLNIQDCFPENIKNNVVGKIIEQERMKFRDPSVRLMSYL